MSQIKYKVIVRSLLIILVIIGCLLIIKVFKELNSPPITVEETNHIISIYSDNKEEFKNIVSYAQSIDEEIYIERVSGANYKVRKYDTEANYYTIDDTTLDKSLRRIFENKFTSISKDRGAIYFEYKSGLAGMQGVVYTDNPKNLVRYKNLDIKEIESNWYYFVGN